MQNTRTNNLQHALAPNTAAAAKKITVSSTAATIETLGSYTFHANTNYVLVNIEAQPVRVDPSGNDPTTAVGQPRLAGREVLMSIAEAKASKWIKSGATDATLQVSEYV